ncbi:MAG: MmyB family transcriptional regulator [Rhodoferax sp.]
MSHTLKTARQERRWSQLELALRMGVSQRHVSFVESGRARPSRELLHAWLRELDAPLALRNDAMLQAGYAPLYAQGSLQDAALAPAQAALAQLLQAHDPQPSMVLDAHWNLLQMNRGARWLAGVLMPALVPYLQGMGTALQGAATLNLLDFMAHPEGMLARVKNLEEVAPGLIAQLRGDAQTEPGVRQRVQTLLQSLQGRISAQALSAVPSLLPPVLTTRLETPLGELAFFSLFTTFGSPQHITLASLRVEHMCAADAHTRQVLEREVGRL